MSSSSLVVSVDVSAVQGSDHLVRVVAELPDRAPFGIWADARHPEVVTYLALQLADAIRELGHSPVFGPDARVYLYAHASTPAQALGLALAVQSPAARLQ